MAGTNNPLKRNESLRNLSRDHHFGLLFCWKIRSSLNKVELVRITNYADYFYRTHLLPHFKEEERSVFPLLGEETRLVNEAMNDHILLRRLFEDLNKNEESLSLIEKLLEKHIRFEERVLFKELQKRVSEKELMSALGEIDKPEEDTWEDKFWERKT